MTCRQEGCSIRASFNFSGHPARCCKEHSVEGMVNVYACLCRHEDCTTIAYYNLRGETERIYCAKHKLLEMVNVVTKTCKVLECGHQPCFGHEGSTPEYCTTHKEDGMVNLRERRCAHDECIKKPNFNFIGETRGVFCVTHKKSGMVDVIGIKCKFDGCLIRPSFGPIGGSRMWCLKHKTTNDINLIPNYQCHQDGCLTSAAFSLPGSKRCEFCAKHKKPGMINIKSHTCEYTGCMKIPVFAIQGSKTGEFCKEHKKDGMIDVKNSRCECGKINPVFNFPGRKRGVACTIHKCEGMVDVVSKLCATHMCGVHVTNKYKGYCARCFVYTFPGEAVATRFKTRENAVATFLRQTWPDVTITHDKRVECHLYRPDFVFDMGSHTVVIEIDENQHRSYDTSCDNKRLMSIFQGLGSRPMIMLRFNPDAYTGYRGCWTRDGKLVDEGRPWIKRLEMLKERIGHWITQEPARTVTVEHLFFDGY